MFTGSQYLDFLLVLSSTLCCYLFFKQYTLSFLSCFTYLLQIQIDSNTLLNDTCSNESLYTFYNLILHTKEQKKEIKRNWEKENVIELNEWIKDKHQIPSTVDIIHNSILVLKSFDSLPEPLGVLKEPPLCSFSLSYWNVVPLLWHYSMF